MVSSYFLFSLTLIIKGLQITIYEQCNKDHNMNNQYNLSQLVLKTSTSFLHTMLLGFLIKGSKLHLSFLIQYESCCSLKSVSQFSQSDLKTHLTQNRANVFL